MRRVGLAVAAAVVLLSTACGGSDDAGDEPVPYGARSCSDWAGRMDDAERWDAAETLLMNAKGTVEDTDGGRAPSTGAVRQFEADLGAMCDRGASDDLLGRLAVDAYRLNRVFYSI